METRRMQQQMGEERRAQAAQIPTMCVSQQVPVPEPRPLPPPIRPAEEEPSQWTTPGQ